MNAWNTVMKLVQVKMSLILLNDEIISIHKEINDRENHNEHGNEIKSIKRQKNKNNR